MLPGSICGFVERLAGWMFRADSHSPGLVLEYRDQHVTCETWDSQWDHVHELQQSQQGPKSWSPPICNTPADHELFMVPMIFHHCHPCVTAGSPELSELCLMVLLCDYVCRCLALSP